MKSSIPARLSVMMFLQFFVWGSWFVTLALCLSSNGLGDYEGGAYGTAPIAAIIAPLFLGLVADRFFSSEKVMGLLFLLGGVFMCVAANASKTANGELMYWMMLGHMLCYMPTLGLGNSIAFSNIPDQNLFPKIRVWGTIGWIVAGLFVGFMGWSESLNIFWTAGISSLLLGLYSFTLPHTPPPAQGTELDLRAIFMFDAFKLLAKPGFAVFMLCSTLICIPSAYYYGITSKYLPQTGFTQPAAAMTIGQMSEIFFMILIPFFFRRLGVKYMILVGMLAWVARYLLFAFAAPNQVVWMLFLGIALHGVCYDFFFVTGFMYADKVADKSIRGQVQSMLVFFTQGIGMYFGYKFAFGKLGSTVSNYKPLEEAIKAEYPQSDLTFADQLKNMFNVLDLDKIDKSLLSNTMGEWKEFWYLPAGMAAAIAVLFFVLFWDKMSNHGGAEKEHGGDAEI